MEALEPSASPRRSLGFHHLPCTGRLSAHGRSYPFANGRFLLVFPVNLSRTTGSNSAMPGFRGNAEPLAPRAVDPSRAVSGANQVAFGLPWSMTVIGRLEFSSSMVESVTSSVVPGVSSG